MTEYRWYFGYGKAGEWLQCRPGTYPTGFWEAFGGANSRMGTIYIYDEYDNLLYVASKLDVFYKRLASTIRKKLHLNSPNDLTFYESDPAGALFCYLDSLNVKNSPKFSKAISMVEQAIVEKAKRLKRAA